MRFKFQTCKGASMMYRSVVSLYIGLALEEEGLEGEYAGGILCLGTQGLTV